MIFASTVYITLDMALEIHQEQLAEHGGHDGIRDMNSLESALEMPKQGLEDGTEFYQSVFDKAAVYAFHISQGQPFVDGNKRVGLVVALTFIALNKQVAIEATDETYELMIEVAKKNKTKDDLSEHFRNLFIDSMNG